MDNYCELGPMPCFHGSCGISANGVTPAYFSKNTFAEVLGSALGI